MFWFCMDKKSYLLKVLTQLEPIWSLSKWLEFLVEEWNLDNNITDVLINAIEWSIHNTKSIVDKEKLQKWLMALQKMKELEEKSIIEDENDLAVLENLLDNI